MRWDRAGQREPTLGYESCVGRWDTSCSRCSGPSEHLMVSCMVVLLSSQAHSGCSLFPSPGVGGVPSPRADEVWETGEGLEQA